MTENEQDAGMGVFNTRSDILKVMGAGATENIANLEHTHLIY